MFYVGLSPNPSSSSSSSLALALALALAQRNRYRISGILSDVTDMISELCKDSNYYIDSY